MTPPIITSTAFLADKLDSTDCALCPATVECRFRDFYTSSRAIKHELLTQDEQWTRMPFRGSAANNNLSGVSLMLRAVTGLKKTDLHTLFDLHVRAHGEGVSDVELAETVFGVDRGITPFDLDRITAEYM